MRILTDTGLRPAAGTAPATWPTWVGPLGIAIDHILARDLALGPVTAHALPGSDHRWVVATVGR
jgi:endonuclease/exonuclease/phosphatase (EEP) superfamily protein YafD